MREINLFLYSDTAYTVISFQGWGVHQLVNENCILPKLTNQLQACWSFHRRIFYKFDKIKHTNLNTRSTLLGIEANGPLNHI
jgi:hypothetical protein